LVVFGYSVEWALYVVYLSEKFGWSSFTLGAGQMAGDIGGALILLSSTGKPLLAVAADQGNPGCAKLGSTNEGKFAAPASPKAEGRRASWVQQYVESGTESDTNSDMDVDSVRRDPHPGSGGSNARSWYGCCLALLLKLPHGLVWIGALYAGSLVAFASPDKTLAMTAQVVLGTLFVLLVQGSSEIVEWLCWRGADTHSAGDVSYRTKRYQHYLAVSDAAYVASVSVANFLAYMLLESGQADVLLYSSAAAIGAYFAIYAVLFAANKPPTSTPTVPSRASSSTLLVV
jgi:hypothetical protein